MLVVEAGTGVGKTFAYLAPLLLGGRRACVVDSDAGAARPAVSPRHSGADRLAGIAGAGRDAQGAQQLRVCPSRGSGAAGAEWPAPAGSRPGRRRLSTCTAGLVIGSGRSGRAAGPGRTLTLAPVDHDRPATTAWAASCPRVCRLPCESRPRQTRWQADWVVVNHHLFFADHLVQSERLAELLPGRRCRGAGRSAPGQRHRLQVSGPLGGRTRSSGARSRTAHAGRTVGQGHAALGTLRLVAGAGRLALEHLLPPVLAPAAGCAGPGSHHKG